MLKYSCRLRDQKKGQTANSILGFAVLLPILLLMVCGMVEAGTAYSTKMIVDNACCDAVRAIEQRPQTTYSELNAQVQSACSFVADPQKVKLGCSVGAIRHIDYNYRFFNQKTNTDDIRPSHYVYTIIDVTVSVEKSYVTPIGSMLAYAGISFSDKGYTYVAHASGAANTTNGLNW